MAKLHKERPVPEMCTGRARESNTKCEVIAEPGYFYKKYGKCFARVDMIRARQIEKEIKENQAYIKTRRGLAVNS